MVHKDSVPIGSPADGKAGGVYHSGKGSPPPPAAAAALMTTSITGRLLEAASAPGSCPWEPSTTEGARENDERR